MKIVKKIVCVILCFLLEKVSFSNDLFAHKLTWSVGVNEQIFDGEYRQNTRNNFYYINNSLLSINRHADITHSVAFTITGSYDAYIQIHKFFNPFFGLGFDLSFPLSKLNNIDNYSTNIGNFLDLTVRVGNSFKVFDDIFDINVYANGGFGTAIWYANGDSIISYGAREYLESDLKISYGYLMGAGIDVIFKEFYLIGLFYSFHKMVGGQYGSDTASELYKDYGLCHETFVNKYTNHTIGIKFGIQMKI